MIESTDKFADPDRGNIRHWIVCEQSDRWLTASRRFVPAMLPTPLIAVISSSEPNQVRSRVAGRRAAAVLWEIDRDNMVTISEQIALLSIASPKLLQIAAAPDLSTNQQLALHELRVAAILRQIEDMPRWSRLIEGHFAHSSQHLD